MNMLSTYILLATLLVIIIVIIYGWYIMDLASKTIFQGSGAPINMAKVVLSSIQITAQILFGVLVTGIICVLILEKTISSDAGLPIVSGIVGYLLGKSFKDAYEPSNGGSNRNSHNKKRNNSVPA